MQSNATIDLFRQNLETLVTEQNRVTLALLLASTPAGSDGNTAS